MKIKQQKQIGLFLNEEFGTENGSMLFGKQEKILHDLIGDTKGKSESQMKTLIQTILPRIALYKTLQEEGKFGKLMYMHELFKMMPLGDVWNEYLSRQNLTEEWYGEAERYEKEVLSLRK